MIVEGSFRFIFDENKLKKNGGEKNVKRLMRKPGRGKEKN